MGKILVFILWYIWQLPQNLLGLCWMLYLSDRKKIITQNGAAFYASKKKTGGTCLGRYIYLSPSSMRKEPVYNHEFGHYRQSKMLGWLYLIVIGIPSLMYAWYYRSKKDKSSYHNFYTERWANKLGGISGYKGEFSYKKGVLQIPMGYIRCMYNKYFY